MVMIEYNDFPKNYTIRKIEETSPMEYVFMHVREASEIDKIVKLYPDVVTILIDRDVGLKGNDSDDLVYDYVYDYVIENNGTLEDLECAVETFMKQIEVDVR